MNTEIISVDFKEKSPVSAKILPLILTAAVILADQLTKFLIVKSIPLTYPPTVAWNCFGDFFQIIYTRNPVIAFSIGAGIPDILNIILFRILPLLVIIAVIIIYFRNNDFSMLQRIAICGITGGGIGNLIDRFMGKGVVDFLDVKWFGLKNCPFAFLQWDRWPTFNVADAAVVCCGALLIISFLISSFKERKKQA